MAVLTKDQRFEEYANIQKAEGGSVTMCEVLDKMISEGYNKGIGFGEAHGRSEDISIGEANAKKKYEAQIAEIQCCPNCLSKSHFLISRKIFSELRQNSYFRELIAEIQDFRLF